MKVFIAVLICCATLAYGEEEWEPKTVQEIKQIKAECLQDNQISEELKNKIANMEFPDEEPVRKYLLCVAEKLGTFSAKDGIFADRTAKQFHVGLEESEVLEVVQGCSDKNEQGNTADVWFYRMHKCILHSKVGEKFKEYLKKRQEEAAKSASV